ncbi:hypothetical protein LZ32DRAFT_602017 [Colletotrichum eremochloae]|nr:hypothetical protein LZ32DRAFT_602017 [Colletotrichum eremochloae]
MSGFSGSVLSLLDVCFVAVVPGPGRFHKREGKNGHEDEGWRRLRPSQSQDGASARLHKDATQPIAGKIREGIVEYTPLSSSGLNPRE